MARAGKSLLGSSGPRAADNLGRGQKLRAAAGQCAALAGALPENLLTRRPQAGHAPARFSFAAPAPAVTLVSFKCPQRQACAIWRPRRSSAMTEMGQKRKY